jgi:uncharacterized protein
VSLVVHHDARARRFETQMDGASCVLDYRLATEGGVAVMTIVHTGVPSEVAGRGIAAALVQAAVTLARAERWRVVPACSYAAVWLKRHPDCLDLCR